MQARMLLKQLSQIYNCHLILNRGYLFAIFPRFHQHYIWCLVLGSINTLLLILWQCGWHTFCHIILLRKVPATAGSALAEASQVN